MFNLNTPEIQAIREKFKLDRQARLEAMKNAPKSAKLKLSKEEKVKLTKPLQSKIGKPSKGK